VGNATVEGRRVSLVEYLLERELDTRLPFVADYAGAMTEVERVLFS